jgi:hypothetical protein
MPPEAVWWPAAEEPAETWADGQRFVALVRDPEGRLRVGRLTSTEPRDYLDPRWRPGRPWRGAAGAP